MKQAVEADDESPDDQAECATLLIPYRKPEGKRFREIMLPPNTARTEVRPKGERRANLTAAIARGRHWLHEIVPANRSAPTTSLLVKSGESYL